MAEHQTEGAPEARDTNTKIVPTPGGRPVRHPATQQDDILTGTGFLRWLESIRVYSRDGADACTGAAGRIYTGIIRSTRLPGLVEKRVLALRIRRGLAHLASLQEESARTAIAVSIAYRRACGEPSSDRRRSDTFDPSR